MADFGYNESKNHYGWLILIQFHGEVLIKKYISIGEPLPMERTRSMKEDKSPGFGSFKRG